MSKVSIPNTYTSYKVTQIAEIETKPSPPRTCHFSTTESKSKQRTEELSSTISLLPEYNIGR